MAPTSNTGVAKDWDQPQNQPYTANSGTSGGGNGISKNQREHDGTSGIPARQKSYIKGNVQGHREPYSDHTPENSDNSSFGPPESE